MENNGDLYIEVDQLPNKLKLKLIQDRFYKSNGIFYKIPNLELFDLNLFYLRGIPNETLKEHIGIRLKGNGIDIIINPIEKDPTPSNLRFIKKIFQKIWSLNIKVLSLVYRKICLAIKEERRVDLKSLAEGDILRDV